MLAAICVVAIVRAQDGSWQPAASNSPPPEPAFLPPQAIGDAVPVAMQIDDPPQQHGPAPAAFGFGARRQGNQPGPQPIAEAPANAEPLPFPPVNQLPPAEYAQQPATPPGPVPQQRSVLRRPGQPAPQAAPQPETYPTSAPVVPNESVQQQPVYQQQPSAAPRSVLKRPTGPVIGEAAAPIAPVQEALPPIADVPSGSSRRQYDPATPASPTPRNPARSGFGAASDIMVSSQSPRLRVELAGPQSLMVGKSAKYTLNLVNDGDVAADDVQLRLNIPAWISVESGESTSGDAAAQADAQGSIRMVWNLPKVKAGSQETLRLQLVAAEGKPCELTADWTCRPTSLKAAIAVKQPQIELSLSGPSDMVFGEEKPFTINVSNPGNGDAEHVVVQLVAGGNAPQTVEVGTVPAGKAKDVNVKVVANQQGGMDLKMTATADGNLRAEAAGRIIVKQAILAIHVEGPPLKFAGAEATYAITVSNTGNAAADDLTVSTTLPTGAKYLGGIDGAQFAGGVLKWKAGLLPPETQRTFDIRCQLNAAGAHRVVAQAIGPRTGAVAHEAETTVEAVSNLKLAVNDPTGPAPTGQDVTYEVQLMNRGSLAAKNVKVVMQFSEGLEPSIVEGAEARLVPGQVLFDTLPELAAGEQVVVHVKAKAVKEGSHRFRVEVVSTDNDTRLVSEGTSRFFTDTRGPANSAATRTATKPKLAPQPIQNIQR